jgi:hypothetical protein
MFNIVHININLLLSDPRLIKIYNSESSLMTLFKDSLFLKKNVTYRNRIHFTTIIIIKSIDSCSKKI